MNIKINIFNCIEFFYILFLEYLYNKKTIFKYATIILIVFNILIPKSTSFAQKIDHTKYKQYKSYFVWLNKDVYRTIRFYCKNRNISIVYFMALIQAESGDYCKNNFYNMTKVVSHAGAIGISQVMPMHVHNRKILFNYKINIDFGTYYIKKCLISSNGNWLLAAQKYNAGIRSNAYKYKNWIYVAKILKYYSEFVKKTNINE